MPLKTPAAAVLDNPYIPLCTPPVLIVLQFLLALAVFRDGHLPDYSIQSKWSTILLTVAFFGLWGLSVPALLLGVRNLIYGSNKLAPAFGIAFNLVYLIGFAAFFILILVIKATN